MSLGEWVMRLPKFMLTHPQEDGKPLLYHVFASLYAASGSQFRPQKPEKVRCLFFYKVIWVGKFILPKFRADVNIMHEKSEFMNLNVFTSN